MIRPLDLLLQQVSPSSSCVTLLLRLLILLFFSTTNRHGTKRMPITAKARAHSMRNFRLKPGQTSLLRFEQAMCDSVLYAHDILASFVRSACCNFSLRHRRCAHLLHLLSALATTKFLGFGRPLQQALLSLSFHASSPRLLSYNMALDPKYPDILGSHMLRSCNIFTYPCVLFPALG